MKSVILFVILVLSACSTQQLTPVKSQQDNQEYYFVKDQSLPLLEMGILFREGSSLDPMGQKGITALTLSTVLENEKINDLASQDAITFYSQVTSDSIIVAASGLSVKKEAMLDYFYQLIQYPEWKPQVFEIKKQRTLQRLKSVNDTPETLADNALKLFLFGNHPYGLATGGLSMDVKKINLVDVKLFYKTLRSVPQPLFYLVGDFDDDFKNKFIQKLGGTLTAQKISGYWPKPADVNHNEILFFPRKDSKQTKIVIGQLSVKDGHPDEYKLRLAMDALGGSFVSRLNQKLRADKSYTYGAQSYLITKKEGGYVQVETSTKPENTNKVLLETLDLLKDFKQNGMTQQELDRSKQGAIADFIKQHETAEGRIWFTLEQILSGVKVKSLEDKINEVKSVSLKSVNEAIKDHFSDTNYKIVVVGPEFILKDLNEVALVSVKNKLEF